MYHPAPCVVALPSLGPAAALVRYHRGASICAPACFPCLTILLVSNQHCVLPESKIAQLYVRTRSSPGMSTAALFGFGPSYDCLDSTASLSIYMSSTPESAQYIKVVCIQECKSRVYKYKDIALRSSLPRMHCSTTVYA